MQLSDITHLKHEMNLVFRKYEQKWMPRSLEVIYICDSRMFWDASNGAKHSPLSFGAGGPFGLKTKSLRYFRISGENIDICQVLGVPS